MPVKKTEETQKKLLEQSLKNSEPFMPYFLLQYEEELTKTANHLRELYKIPIYTD
jgi:hypothetical protein